jgi:hypothetical protein
MTVTGPVVRDYEGWRTPDESWLDMEATEDVETFSENMVLGEEEDDKDKKDILETMNKYEEWTRQEHEVSLSPLSPFSPFSLFATDNFRLFLLQQIDK